MTLAEAVDLVRSGPSTAAISQKLRPISLVCGFEPMHLGIFLRAYVAKRFPGEAVDLKTGLYGDLAGNLAGAAGSGSEAAAVLVEWGSLDSRLGLRSSGGWGLSTQQDILATCRDRFSRLIEGLKALASRMTVVLAGPTLPIPLLGHSTGGQITRNELELQRLAASFLAEAGGIDRVSVLNPARLDAVSPVATRLDAMMELKAGFPYGLGHASALAQQIVELLFPRPPLKGLITDLDDTLWSGLVGEVGPSAVNWSLADHAQIHGLYQQLLRHFSEIGVLLGIASKNELSVIEETLRRGDLYVPATVFFPVRADWGPKSRHIAEILRTWNIGADSVAFIDDNAMELEEVKTAFPSMTCLQFSKKNPAKMVALFERLRDLFGKPVINREDTLRQATIQAAAGFEEFAKSAANGDFVRGLQGRVTFDARKDPSNSRVLELINKTNQFNLNGARIAEGEWLRHLEDPASFVVSVSYEDKFGPLGVIGVVSGQMAGARLEVSTWVMSCRAFSRRIEFHTLAYLIDSMGAETVSLAFRATDRNQPLQEFLSSMPAALVGLESVLTWADFVDAGYDLPHRVSVS